MTNGVSVERWQDAQQAERGYWAGLGADQAELARILAEKVEGGHWAAVHGAARLREGDLVEIGIGPLGVGCIHFVQGAGERALVGVDPLELLPREELSFPEPLVALLDRCRSHPYEHLQAKGESTGLEEGRFALASCYNVLDHVQDPGAVLREAARILAPGGLLLLACDVTSLLGDLRFRVYVRRRLRESILVRAHPHRFRVAGLRRLLDEAGFRIVAEDAPGRLHGLTGRTARALFLGEKAG